MDNMAEKDSVEQSGTSLSKHALKRLEKRQSFEETKMGRRRQEREKKKKRKAEAKERGEVPQGPSRKLLKGSTMEKSNCDLRVVVDVAFDDLMSDWEICKVHKQLQRCYSINRRLADPLQFYITNLYGKTKDKFDSVQGSSLWDVHFKSESYLDVFSKCDIVYLTSESPNVLEDIVESKVYIIGGLVDHNRLKGHCLSIAETQEVNHARLPIDEHIELKTRKVLTINDVFQILAMKSQGATWAEAFLNTIPQRKGAKAKDELEVEDSGNLDNPVTGI